MDANRFDTVIQNLSNHPTRRTTLGLALASVLGALASAEADGKRRKQRRKKRKGPKPTPPPGEPIFNEFGCVNVGGFCENDGQCCSGICTGQRCRAHDTGGCRAGQETEFCGGTDVSCTGSAGDTGLCSTTTGQGAFCGASGNCFACNNDSDCIDVCGPEAACVICDGCPETGGTGCLGVAFDSCTI